MSAAAPATFGQEWRGGGGAVVLSAAVGVGFGLSSLPFYTLGVFAGPLAQAFGWSRAAVQSSFAFMMLGVLVSAPVAGWWIDRHGVRRVALASLIGFAIGLILLGLNPGSLPLWYATWFVVALLGVGTTPLSWTRGVAAWFVAGRGTAIGIALAGTGVMAFAAPPLVTALIARFGWRGAYWALAALILVVALPLVWRYFREREVVAGAAEAQAEAGLSLGQALRGYRFWLLVVAIIVIGASVAGIIPSLVPLLTDKGMSKPSAATFASLLGLNVILGRLASGWLVDRVWAPGVAAIFLSLPAAACLLLTRDGLDPLAIGVAATLVGLAAGAEIDLIAFLTIRYFGMRQYGRIYGWLWAAFAVSAGIAPMVFGRVFDRAGSYDPALYGAAVLLLTGGLSLLALGRYPRFPD